jgi:cell division transport system permease protein
MKEIKASLFTKLGRILKWSFTSFWRNRLLSIASILVMIITLLTISVFGILNIAIDRSIETISQKMDFIAYVKESTTETQVKPIIKGAEDIESVTSVIYIDKKKALEKWQSYQKGTQLADIYNEKDNPFPRSLEIKISDPENISSIDTYFQSETVKPYIEKTSLGKSRSSIEKLINLTKTIKKGGWILSAFFLLISVLIVYNTVRLAIHSRKDEIEIMTLVGASPSSIKWPFIIEGVLYGIIGTLVSILLIFIAFKYFSASGFLNKYLSAQYYAFFATYWVKILFLELAVAILIGVSCSFIAVKKYIKI